MQAEAAEEKGNLEYIQLRFREKCHKDKYFSKAKYSADHSVEYIKCILPSGGHKTKLAVQKSTAASSVSVRRCFQLSRARK